jgi:hypothetical protein
MVWDGTGPAGSLFGYGSNPHLCWRASPPRLANAAVARGGQRRVPYIGDPSSALPEIGFSGRSGTTSWQVAFVVWPELKVILLSGSEVTTQALALVDAFVPKLEANQQLLPMIAELCSRPHDGATREARGVSA